MSNIVERLKALVNDGTELPFEDIMTVEQAIAEIARLQAELSSLKACEGTDTDTRPRYSMKRMRDEIAKAKAYARAEALEEALREALLCPVGTQEGWQGKLDMRNEIAAAIRRLNEGATPEPVPSLAKLFDDIAAKQRSINDQFEEFMSDVEDGKP